MPERPSPQWDRADPNVDPSPETIHGLANAALHLAKYLRDRGLLEGDPEGPSTFALPLVRCFCRVWQCCAPLLAPKYQAPAWGGWPADTPDDVARIYHATTKIFNAFTVTVEEVNSPEHSPGKKLASARASLRDVEILETCGRSLLRAARPESTAQVEGVIETVGAESSESSPSVRAERAGESEPARGTSRSAESCLNSPTSAMDARLEQDEQTQDGLNPFKSGTVVFYPDRVELCDWVICTDSRSQRQRDLLELLARKAKGKGFVAYSGSDLAKKLQMPGNAVAGVIRDLRGKVKAALEHARLTCRPDEVILSGGPGYRFSDLLTVQFENQEIETALPVQRTSDHDTEDLLHQPDERSGDTDRDTVNVGCDTPTRERDTVNDTVNGIDEIGRPAVKRPDRRQLEGGDEASLPAVEDASPLDGVKRLIGSNPDLRQRWILQRLKSGAKLKTVDIIRELGCSVSTAKRDLKELVREKEIRYVGSAKNGYYVLIQDEGPDIPDSQA